ncbi:serine protease [Corallococcus carmarthensis]|uniref:Serine protease n=1 Tax=Corallococcus carmarthensis TaxID=2316728 RepID=A0A3A8K5T8_9BACT|nr:serine protease [Corallococcus carmarthensis]RKH02559.1 serine protease [Corallococcus carmarthensis]
MTKRAWLAGLPLLGLLGCGGAPDELGVQTQEIIGGGIAARYELPYQVRIHVSGAFTCGGTLIRAGWVVTAAHCVQGVTPASMRIYAGDLRLGAVEADEQYRAVSRKVMHPSYIAPDHDVALLQLAQPFNLSQAVQPLTLPDAPAPLGAPYIASGWGRTQTGPTSDALKRVSLSITSTATCRDLVGSTYVNGTVLCTAPSATANVCTKDDGGPLAFNGTLYGIVSGFGSNQCNTFSMFTNVATYTPWIRSVINGT